MEPQKLSDRTIDSIIEKTRQELEKASGKKVAFDGEIQRDLRHALETGALETKSTPVDQNKIASQLSNYLTMHMDVTALDTPERPLSQRFTNLFRKENITPVPTTLSKASMHSFDNDDLHMLCSEVSQVALKKEAEKEKIKQEQEAAARKIQGFVRTQKAQKTLTDKQREEDKVVETPAVLTEKREPARRAATTDDLHAKPRLTTLELGSARDSREMAALRTTADAIFQSAQADHAKHQEEEEKAKRAEAKKLLEQKLSTSLRTEIKAAKNESWRSWSGEYYAERDKLADIMATKVAQKISDNPNIPTHYMSDHGSAIAETTTRILKTETMQGTGGEDSKEDKTYKRVAEEFLEHRTKVTDIEEVLTGVRATGRSFDDKVADEASKKVAEEAKKAHLHQTKASSITK
jgi:hypothetical protein